ncbi:MAG: hypothetical protein H0U89_02730, partial [Acidimicrobiia bacterium]|nr:hypothetical protein [Acidimicrobiia bacterium]
MPAVPSFSDEALQQLTGPAWLAERRRAALARFESTELPSAEEELWRYSRIAALDLDRYRPADPPAGDAGAPLPVPLVDALAAAGPRAGLVVLRDG